MTMATGDDIKLPLTSRDVNAERLAQFRELFPEASTEGKFDLSKLAQLLGGAVTEAPEIEAAIDTCTCVSTLAVATATVTEA